MIDGRKVTALMILHYGKEYLSAAIQAVYPVVDEVVIVYTPKPSHGHGTTAPCPESFVELEAEALKYDPDKKIFITHGLFGNEGQQRGESEQICVDRGADIIVRFDSDEVWDTETLKESIKLASGSEKKYFGIGHFVNFWRSFNHACYDGFQPIRLINVHAQNNETANISGTIYHFSCAQSDIIMRYKYEIHGHKNELRPDWFEKTYLGWKEGQGDLHMTSIGLWNATPFDKNTLPEVLKNHPNFNKEVIS